MNSILTLPRWARKSAAAATAILAIITAVLASGCADVADGQALSPLYDPFRVGGMAAVDGPSGVRDDAPKPVGTVQNTDGGETDRLVLLSLNDIEEYWKKTYDGSLEGQFKPVEKFVSYDSTDPNSPVVCRQPTFGEPNAFFCRPGWLFGWDRGKFVPLAEKFFGDTTVAGVMGHEYGHAIQQMADLVDRSTPGLVFEQQADCFGGSYLRWVAEGHSPRFTLSTGDGLNHVLAGVITSKDPIVKPGYEELIEEGHGTALDRVSAFQVGFVQGPGACAAIDMNEIKTRRGDLPLELQVDKTGSLQSGEVAIDQDTLTALTDQLGEIFALNNKPTLSFDKAAQCPDGPGSPPASYCPSTNTISLDVGELQKMGEPADRSDYKLVQGDDTALSIVMARYALAVQHERGLPLDTAAAALRTACLTGVAHRQMFDPAAAGFEPLAAGKGLTLTAGDVDEAVAGLLVNGLAAADVNGNTVPAGFQRITAFRSGLTDNSEPTSNEDLCYKRFTDK